MDKSTFIMVLLTSALDFIGGTPWVFELVDRFVFLKSFQYPLRDIEPITKLSGEYLTSLCKMWNPHAVNELQSTTRPSWVADAENRANVAFVYGCQNTFV
jgi:hypothetical protein